MPVFQATLFLGDGQNSGFSESYFWTGPDYTAAAAATATMAAKRLAPLHMEYQLIGMRISDVAIFGDSYLPTIPASPFPIQGEASDALYKRPNPAIAALHRMEAGPLHRGHKFLRGIPLQLITGEHLKDLTTIVGYSTWISELIANWQLAVTLHGTGTKVYLPISRIIALGDVRRRPGRPFGAPRGRRRIR